MDESAADDKKPLLWNNKIELFETPKESGIRDTYDD
jgi:hypothetical protein